MRSFVVFLLTISLVLPKLSYTQSKNEKISSSIARSVLDKKLVILITNSSSSYGNLNFSEGKQVLLINDKFTCELPFQGSSRINSYGSQDLSIKANNSPIMNIKSNYNEKRKYYNISFEFENDTDNELYNVTIKLFTNGKVIMNISSNKRASTTYNGGINVYI